MAVAFDNAVTADSSFASVATLTTGAFTIGAGANRVAIVGLTVTATTSLETCSVGGVPGSIIANTRSTAIGETTLLFVVINPPSGSQTATVSWTTAGVVSVSVVTFTGADQSTGANGGAIASGFAASVSRSVVSSAGDMTCSLAADDGNAGTITSNQTKKTSDYGCMDVGSGTANPTHTWSNGVTAENIQISAANVIQATGGTDTLFAQAWM